MSPLDTSVKKASSRARRQKRLANYSGDRKYFSAVRKLRRDKIDKWQLENSTKRFKMRLTQMTLQAKKRQWKQERRDLMKTMPVGSEVRPSGKRVVGIVLAHTTDPEFPITVQFSSGIIEDFAPEKLRLVDDRKTAE